MVQDVHTGELLRLSLEGWGRLGETLAHYDGMEVRVFGGIPGEEVVVEVIKHRRDYIAASVVEVVASSPHRVAAPCPYFGPCTGCQWQHIDYQHQLQIKRQVVIDALSGVRGFEATRVLPAVAAQQQYGYRNHARFTVGRKKGELGFVNRESRRFVPIGKCLLMHSWINAALEQLQGRCSETSQLSIRYGVNTGDFLVQPSLKSQEVPLLSGQKHYRESMYGREFRIAASSFFQVNTYQAMQMVELVKEGLQLSGEGLLVDAYAGVGTFAILLAPHARKVIAIEESASAVQDATANALGLGNIQFLQGKTEDVLAQIEERPQGVILDPPRAGCHRSALEALIKLAPSRVVYVSCDPSALARDLETLCQGHFRLERVQPIDMFPQTHHVECIATLSYEGRVPQQPRDCRASPLPWRERIEVRGDSPPSQPSPIEGEGVSPALRVNHPSNLHRGLVLASTSPRRRELLSGLGIGFRVLPPSVSEDMHTHETPKEMVERLALAKARSVSHTLSSGLVIGADSVVVLDGRVLGKPADAAEAREMLRSLRGKEHQVMTGVAVVDTADGHARTASQVSVVVMREYSDEEIEAYVASGEPMDKAGAYAVQDRVFRPAARLEGCYTNVMGLPLCLLIDLLKNTGLDFDPQDRVRVPDECSRCPLKGAA